jgi:hypothetical protein
MKSNIRLIYIRTALFIAISAFLFPESLDAQRMGGGRSGGGGMSRPTSTQTRPAPSNPSGASNRSINGGNQSSSYQNTAAARPSTPTQTPAGTNKSGGNKVSAADKSGTTGGNKASTADRSNVSTADGNKVSTGDRTNVSTGDRTNINTGDRNVNIDNSRDINVNRDIDVNRNVYVRPPVAPYPRPPYAYGGYHYNCYHPYHYHPYHPYSYGPYYHPWGFFVATVAVTAMIITVANQQYYYDQGIYYVSSGDGYTVVQAPVGATVTELPPETTTVVVNETTNNYYYGGTYYEKDGEKYVVVPPTAGTIVPNLPEGGEEIKIGDITYVKVGETYYQPVEIDGKAMYEVVNVEPAKEE